MRRPDPRLYQIASLSGLLVYGLGWLGFEFDPLRIGTILAAALLTQWACSVLWKLPAFDPKSALISALSLCLLLRTPSLGLAAVAAGAAISSKFVLKWKNKHLFNPTNFALIVLMLISERVWVSPGQWGSAAFFGFLIACLGGLVINRAARSDVTWAFLAFYAAVLFGRALWLGDPFEIPLHQLQSGALLIFAFFMISDPRTTPDSRTGRILFGLAVAIGGGFVQFVLFRTNGLLWSLAVCALAVPLADWLLPGVRYRWKPTAAALRPAYQEGAR